MSFTPITRQVLSKLQSIIAELVARAKRARGRSPIANVIYLWGYIYDKIQ